MTHEAIQRAIASFEAALKELDADQPDLVLVRKRMLDGLRQMEPIATDSPALARVVKRYREALA